MRVSPRHVVVLGARGTGATELIRQLRSALTAHPGMVLSEQSQICPEHDFALLLGLDQSVSNAASQTERQQHDAELREQLQAMGKPYRVVYGTGATRLHNALLALGLDSEDKAIWQARQDAQFDLNRGRTPWSCEKCSDPDCEHRLFTGLIKPTSP